MAKKKRKKSRPFPATQAALKECKKRGWPAGVVERNVGFRGGKKFGNTKHDLFGCIDVVALRRADPGARPVWWPGCLGIQATSSTANGAARRDKIGGLLEARQWLAACNQLEVWCFPKRKVKRGGKAFKRVLQRWRAELITAPAEIVRWSQVEEGE